MPLKNRTISYCNFPFHEKFLLAILSYIKTSKLLNPISSPDLSFCSLSLAVKDWTYAFPKEFLNNYCYIHSTFIVPNNDKLEEESIYLNNGLGSYQTGKTDQVVFQSYYQWITLLLFIQGR